MVLFQGDYIKHPVLFELSHKYGFTDNFPESALPNRLEEIKEAIRREIRKELKVSYFHTMNKKHPHTHHTSSMTHEYLLFL